jgi:hypothetical protein
MGNKTNEITLKEFKELYKQLESKEFYVIRYESTGRVLGFEPAPEILMGRIPVCEMHYVVEPAYLRWKNDLFSLMVGTYGERVFDSKEEALAKAEELNKLEQQKNEETYGLKTDEKEDLEL